jgi:DNA polymerase-3 subunit gamma/tau
LQAELVARTAECWTLRVESGSLAQSGARERLQAALAEAGHAVQLQVELGAVRTALRAATRWPPRSARRRRGGADGRPFRAGDDARVWAKIVPGSVKPL